MRTLKHLSILLCLVAFYYNTYSQTPFSCIIQQDSLSKDSALFHISTDIIPFLKNNEYFSPIVEGYTLFGTNFKAGGYAQPSSKTKIYFGLNAIKYYGESKINTFVPELYIQHAFNKQISVMMGSLSNRPETNLLPLLTNHENILSESPNEGLAFAFRTNRLQWDIWVAWLQFLHPYEHSQEKIFFGNVFEYNIIKHEQFEMGIPVQFTAYHIGGQINDVWMPLHMVTNNAVGLSLKLKQKKRSLTARYFYVGYTDLSSNSDYVYKNGDGHFADLTLQAKHIQTSVGYWQGYQFYSPFGETMYSSISGRIPLDNPPTNQQKRKLITAHLYYNTELAKGLTLLCGAQLFYDTKNSICDYSYSFILRYFFDKSITGNRK